ncbi:MAG: SpoIIE family protein phosphatase [Saprospiraceae bacterium]|nr:SpoIIE family protein phosphatase [Saprospiraceae bacterium]
MESSCSFIGAFEKLPEIKEECIHLENDTMILCFTDGLIYLKNNKDEFFGDEAIEKFLDENSDLHPEKFNEKLLKEINDFRGELEINDDIAVLTCKIF